MSMEATPHHHHHQSGRRHASMASQSPSALGQSTGGATDAGADENRPKRLLDLPVDVLSQIVRELSHTNDLCSLALCHSALHALAIPHIYSRFDIVWPDSAASSEPRTGVDALTYGLSTLVMADDVFGRRKQSLDQKARRRRGNFYAQFTRKFSLGNGPPEWVQDYLITKEGGKMLGTMVALAVARMRNLESFVWDMPTGVLRAVWDSLSSLDDHDDDIPCRLDRVAVRCHNNFAEPRIVPAPAPRRQTDAPPPLSDLDHVEHPSFSILPPLKSLSVLDIDEVQYLDEMSLLVRRSLQKLRHLRVGVALHATHRDFVTVWDGEHVHQIDKANPELSCVTIGEKRLGGVLGILTGLFFDLRSSPPQTSRPNRLIRRSNATIGAAQVSGTTDGVAGSDMAAISDGIAGLEVASPEDAPHEAVEDGVDDSSVSSVEHVQAVPKSLPSDSFTSESSESPETEIDSPLDQPLGTKAKKITTPFTPPGVDAAMSETPKKLTLESLELEQVPLSIPVLQDAIDWAKLTTLTLLHCPNHEHLWKILRRLYSPNISSPRKHYVTNVARASTKATPNMEFRLNLRNIFTDTVSSSLISFIKETLQPNTLESIFLLQAPVYSSTVTIDTIFRGVLRRHRASLKKVLVDSGEKGAETVPEANSYWRRWMLNREILKFLAKMPSLRELGAALDYRDWHFFLQSLPAMPQLRSLYIPFFVNFSHGNLADTRELALQIVDIVVLRPEIELCYIGIIKKCFEILELRPGQANHGIHGSSNIGEDSGQENSDDDDDDDEDHDDDDDDNESQESSDSDETDSDSDSDSEGSEASHGHGTARLRLREILYYDDKVSVFKARHGRL